MENRLSKLPGNQGVTFATFVFADEGHTLGNALRSVILDYPNVKMCSYNVPHPAEKRIHFTISTTGESAVEILKRGLQDLEKMCDHIIDTFDRAYEKHKFSQDISLDTT